MTFQSTLPRRERPRRRVLCIGRLAISIHAPAKGATGAQCFVSAAAEFQSTLPRRERQSSHHPLHNICIFQSTLPRRERPAAARDYRAWVEISIHAPAKGATYRAYSCPVSRSFQSTLPRRERPPARSHDRRFPGISIHAPAKGATYHKRSCCRTGAFQSTLPRRERHASITPSAIVRHFNPRSREGSDRSLPQGSHAARTISIHAPAKGATSYSPV